MIRRTFSVVVAGSCLLSLLASSIVSVVWLRSRRVLVQGMDVSAGGVYVHVACRRSGAKVLIAGRWPDGVHGRTYQAADQKAVFVLPQPNIEP